MVAVASLSQYLPRGGKRSCKHNILHGFAFAFAAGGVPIKIGQIVIGCLFNDQIKEERATWIPGELLRDVANWYQSDWKHVGYVVIVAKLLTENDETEAMLLG